MVWYEVVWCVLIRMCGWSRERGSRESRRIEGSVNGINYFLIGHMVFRSKHSRLTDFRRSAELQ